MQRKWDFPSSLLLAPLVLQLLLTASCTQRQAAPANKSEQPPKTAETTSANSSSESRTSAGTHDGVQLTVLSISRTKERDVLPGFSTGQKMVARKGSEFALVQLKVKSLEAGKKLDVKRLELWDAKGNKYKCVYEATDLCDPRPGDETTCELPFNVPAGVVLTKLHLGDLVIDLAGVEKK